MPARMVQDQIAKLELGTDAALSPSDLVFVVSAKWFHLYRTTPGDALTMDNSDLCDSELSPDGHADRPQEGEMELVIDLPNNNHVTVQASPDHTVLHLKQLIQQALHLSPSEFRLLYADGEPTKFVPSFGGETLHELGIGAGHTLVLDDGPVDMLENRTVLRRGLQPADYQLLDADSWCKLSRAVGGGPEIARPMIMVGDHLQVELYPACIQSGVCFQADQPPQNLAQSMVSSEVDPGVLEELLCALHGTDLAFSRVWYDQSAQSEVSWSSVGSSQMKWELLDDELDLVDGMSFVVEQAISVGGNGKVVWPFFEQLRKSKGDQSWKGPLDQSLAAGDWLDIQVPNDQVGPLWLSGLVMETEPGRARIQHWAPCATWIDQQTGDAADSMVTTVSAAFDLFCRADQQMCGPELERMFAVALVDAHLPVASMVSNWLKGRHSLSRQEYVEQCVLLWREKPLMACEAIKRLGLGTLLETSAGSVTEWVDLTDERLAKWQTHPHVWRQFRDFRQGDELVYQPAPEKSVSARVLSVDWSRMCVELILWAQSPDEPSQREVVPMESQALSDATAQSMSMPPTPHMCLGDVDGSTSHEPGLCGLRNIGNTCFMNSIIQCLVATNQLSAFMLSNQALDEINSTNPLGHHGAIAQEWIVLMYRFWCGEFKVIAPKEFKAVISEFAPMFIGYEQHDSAEFLAFLLDGLHEDLNRVPWTAPAPIKDDDDDKQPEPHDVWTNHKQRNDSICVDLFHSLHRTQTDCARCHKQFTQFEPSAMVSLPLPSPKRQLTIQLVSWKTAAIRGSDHPLVEQIEIHVDAGANMQQLIQVVALEKQLDFTACFVSDLYKNVFEMYPMETAVDKIRTTDVTYLFEVLDCCAFEQRPEDAQGAQAEARIEPTLKWELVYQVDSKARSCGPPLAILLEAGVTTIGALERAANRVMACQLDMGARVLTPHDTLVTVKQKSTRAKPVTTVYEPSVDSPSRLLEDVNEHGLVMEWSQLAMDHRRVRDPTHSRPASKPTSRQSVTLQECLEHFVKPEKLDEDETFRCSSCKARVGGCTRQIQFW
eukprot:TRINITY_DN1497_c0_g1_i3.p1 TRINITY_DN1497_c0_g1~~TRINITY_DN1497_c0_g1_i3.p1  ORF type:complete len:1055 (+),score=235.32 TRINITY_DN1497_c0_g1_i3:39-3203(+)